MTKIAIHQANFIPWLPFFYKMAMVDIFVILKNVQFEKNGFQNRYKNGEEWVTKPVQSGLDLICDKHYVDGSRLIDINMKWIEAIKDTLDIKTRIGFDFSTSLKGTDRLVEIIKAYGGDTYITNPDAKLKYLDEDLIRSHGIDIEYCKVPKNLNIHIFDAFNKFGVDGIIKQLPKREVNEIPYIREWVFR